MNASAPKSGKPNAYSNIESALSCRRLLRRAVRLVAWFGVVSFLVKKPAGWIISVSAEKSMSATSSGDRFSPEFRVGD